MYVQDLDKDTLLYTPKLEVDINEFSIKGKRLAINSAQLDSGKFFLKTYRNGSSNLQFIVNYFTTGKTTKPKTKKKPFDILVHKIVLNNLSFKYRNYNRNNALKRINFDDLDLSGLNTTVLDIDTKKHKFRGQINNLTFKEKSGFYLKNLTTEAIIDTNRMEFKKLLLQTPDSRISDYLLFTYSKFADFTHFINKVYVRTRLRNSHIASKDISFFADATKRMDFNIEVTGEVGGYVKNFKARNFTAKAGKATYIKGNFDIKGLPSINKAVMNLRFTQAHTNKQDAELLAKAFTGKNIKLPAIAHKFGNVYFAGNFNGLIKDFAAKGELKTGLGRVFADVNISVNGQPRYAGIVRAYDFNLGQLLNRKDLGRTSLTAQIKGQGFALKNLSEEIDAKASYFDFRGYRYSNIDIAGDYKNNLFDGKISIKDRNINLDFRGGINLNSKLPVFNFVARIRNTNLHKLGFTKDTVQLNANLSTNFSGNNLNNIQGEFEVRNITLRHSNSILRVDTLDLIAKGLGNSRSLSINSDILDASIQGQYDLNTLPYYFTSVVKKYIPSLKVKLRNSGVQNFEFALRLKYFEPVSVIFIPDLSIPEGAIFNGRFVSSQNIATLTGSSPLIQYKNIKVNNFIIDESTSSSALSIFVTSDRVDLTDKLYIQNINIANILQNDSLSLNVKLSDKDAINQLDLNGLIEFGTDTLAKLSVLPSDVVINREVWRIQEQVKLKFETGKVFIENFELFRNDQLLTLNGVISPNPGDVLNAEFKQFQLTTLNPLTTSAGINLSGELNGTMALSSLLKKPKAESDLTIDSLVMNNTEVGDLTLTAHLDNETRLVEVETNIMKGGKETLFASGTYNASAEENKLNIDLVMDNSEIIIFQPFIKHLVSDMSGNISARLKVTGHLLDPEINGNASLRNAQFTINYLKTPYRITDNIDIRSSVIRLDELELTDLRGSKAIAYGSVDMGNPKMPYIDVTIIARNPFMALNTTAKDNPLYYGVAYGTGTFKFLGPTNNMRIDIDAATKAGTIFNIPLNATESVGNNDFITFVAKDSIYTAPIKQPSFNGLTMTLNLDIDEESQVNIITDLGRLSGEGRSQNLRLFITSAGEFEMYGDYLISRGKFEFTAQDYINKIFEIRRGGSIRWTGDPTEAMINLLAAYEVRASLKDLYIAAKGAGDNTIAQRVQAEAVMALSGILTRPDITFDVNFPNDAYIKDELQSYFSDVNNKEIQALSLIVRRSFAPNTGEVNDRLVINTALSAGTELVFNKLNTIVAEVFNIKSLDLNIRSLNEASASVRLLKERLIITGGVMDNRATNISDFDLLGGSNVTRDIEALYFINKDRTLLARASNKLNNRSFLNPSTTGTLDYVSALGLVYRQDFDNFGEFVKALIGQKRREERKNEQRPTPIPLPVPTATTAPTASAPAKRTSPR